MSEIAATLGLLTLQPARRVQSTSEPCICTNAFNGAETAPTSTAVPRASLAGRLAIVVKTRKTTDRAVDHGPTPSVDVARTRQVSGRLPFNRTGTVSAVAPVAVVAR